MTKTASRPKPPARVHSIREPEILQALAHPTRIALLEALREPGSAAAAARRIGQPRQRVAFHMKALEAAGLIERIGTRRNGNFIETLYQAKAQSFVVAPDATWVDPRRLATLEKQHALQTLVAVGERLQRDAIGLLDQAAFEDREIPSAAVTAELRFATESDRAAFFKEYSAALVRLVEKYQSKEGTPYRVVMAVHPTSENEGGAS
jgi:DNA-binding transcriptional ArsR family regulator